MIEIEQLIEREVSEMPRIDPNLQRARAAVYRPLLDVIEARGIRQTWLAERLGLRRQRLWNYLNGADRVPPDFIARACRELSLPPSLIVVPEPRDRYIQTPRAKRAPATPKTPRQPKQPKTPAKRQPKGGQHDSHATRDPGQRSRSVRPVRRAQRATPDIQANSPRA